MAFCTNAVVAINCEVSSAKNGVGAVGKPVRCGESVTMPPTASKSATVKNTLPLRPLNDCTVSAISALAAAKEFSTSAMVATSLPPMLIIDVASMLLATNDGANTLWLNSNGVVPAPNVNDPAGVATPPAPGCSSVQTIPLLGQRFKFAPAGPACHSVLATRSVAEMLA